MRHPSLLLAALLALPLSMASADPCGMVPPIWEGDGPAITRTGVQQTYVFFKEGVESFVIRPSFSGKVDEFGMLIPFPSPPALRKVDDEIFSHLQAAVSPPPVIVNLYPQPGTTQLKSRGGGLEYKSDSRRRDVVRVLKQEAVGMYEVAVLDAGSAKALGRWMTDHGYQYPKGMDAVVEEYVAAKWCFVAVKTKVGQKPGVTPRPGMRKANPDLPKGATFDGNVQAMGFRFRTPKLVVPMRLSAFNAGKLHNRVYVLSDRPLKIDGVSPKLIEAQLSGEKLVKNLTDLLPIKVLGGELKSLGQAWIDRLRPRRDPTPKNGFAKDLFCGDLEAVRRDALALPHEEREKLLLRIAERLGLRGAEIDALHRAELAKGRKAAVARNMTALAGMTLTVIDGDFPREVLARDNLHFSEHLMAGLQRSDFSRPVPLKGKAGEGKKQAEPEDSDSPGTPDAPRKKSPKKSKADAPKRGAARPTEPGAGSWAGLGFVALLLGALGARTGLPLAGLLIAFGLTQGAPEVHADDVDATSTSGRRA